MKAKFPGRCIKTGAPIKPGDEIIWHGRGRAELAPRYQSDVYRFSSGHVIYRNKRGLCEDAPCCGCCTG